VINHLANVRIDGSKPPVLWLDGLKAAAYHEHVFLKVSGYVDNARINGGKAPEETALYLPVLNAAWDSFGENRLIFGSNWPVSDYAGPYSLIIQIATEFFKDKSFQAKHKFFGVNAQTAYRWRIRE
jgi:predicted TIM-barrel fold metal-dependent hydrolase